MKYMKLFFFLFCFFTYIVFVHIACYNVGTKAGKGTPILHFNFIF